MVPKAVMFSHIIGFSVLFVAAIWDLYTTEVPDLLPVIGILSGIILHFTASIQTGAFEALMWSLSVGAVYSIYGWGMYFAGMWGGADAFAMSVLGFSAPYGLSGIGLLHAADVFLNILVIGFLYTMVYAVYVGFKQGNILKLTYQRIVENEKRISAEVILASALGLLLTLMNGPGVEIFLFMVSMILLYRFLEVLESNAMNRHKKVENLEEGEVVARSSDVDSAKQLNVIGKTAERLSSLPFMGFSHRIAEGFGYSEIVGITREEIENLRNQDIETVEVKKGVRFVPVFPVALLVTDIGLGGSTLLILLSL